jgi:hypothetical protein
MKTIDLTALAIKISGIFLFVLAISMIPDYVSTYVSIEKGARSVNVLYVIAPFFIVAIACTMLLLFPYKISNKLIVAADLSERNHSTSLYQLIAIRLLGVLLLFWSVSDMVFTLGTYLMLRDVTETAVPISALNYPYLVATGVELVFAIVLIRNSNRISTYLDEISK